VRLDSDVRAELDYAAGLLDGVIEEVGVGCDHRAAPVGIDRAERQKIIPANEDPGGLASLQRSRINDLRCDDFSNSPAKYS